jgi:replication factor A1
MVFEDFVQRVLSSRPDLTREEILKMIKEKEKDAKGFLTRESAARAVAADLGVESSKVSFNRRVLIGDLVSGLSNVTITARVILVSPLREFVRLDGTAGKMRCLLIADETGELKAVLWDDKTELQKMENLTNQIVRFSHGYVRLGLGARLELNIGSRGTLEIVLPNVSEGEFPSLTSFFRGIGEISGREGTVNVIGSVGAIHPATTFKRGDGSEGKVRRLELRDNSGVTTVVLWNKKVAELAEIERGSRLKVFRAKVRESYDGYLELHVDSSADVEISVGKPSDLEDYHDAL